MATMASAPIEWPCGLHHVELGDFLLERTAGERDAEHAFLEGARLAVAQPVRAAVLALLVAPDAVIRLVKRAGEVGTGVGQRKSLAPPALFIGQAQHGDAVLDHRLHRHEMHRVDAVRHLEDHALLVTGAAGGRQRCPGGVARGQIERRRVCGLVLEPLRHRSGIARLGERHADERFEVPCQRRAVECGGLFRRHALDRPALDEEPLHRIKRRQRIMARRQFAGLARDAEEIGDEILEQRGERDDEVRFRLAFERGRAAPRRHQPVVQAHVGPGEPGDKRRIEPHQPVAVVKVLEGEAVLQDKVAHSTHSTRADAEFGPYLGARRSRRKRPARPGSEPQRAAVLARVGAADQHALVVVDPDRLAAAQRVSPRPR